MRVKQSQVMTSNMKNNQRVLKQTNNDVQAETTSVSRGKTSNDDQAEIVLKDFLGVTKDEELLENLKEENGDKSADQKDEQGRSSQAKIQKVLHYLQQSIDNKVRKHFVPREISVGPLRAGNAHWLKKELKLELAKTFIKDSGMTAVIFLTEIKRNIRDLKTCFIEGVIPQYYNDDSLARLLFLDGCAVLQFIRSYVSEKLEKFNINSTQADFIQQDLFLFENQIPFKVLTLLMGVIDMGVEKPSFYYKTSIIQFVHENNICATNNAINYYRKRDYHQMIGMLEKIKPVHLLDLLQKVSVFGSIKDVEFDEDETDNVKCTLNVFDQPKNCLLSLANCCREKWPCFTDELEEHGRRVEGQSLRSIQELKSSGITMKLSNSRSLKSVSFGTHCLGIFGHIKLPSLNVNDSTVRKLLNLVAYEACLDSKERYYSVISYLNFLDLLIDTEQDVKDLRKARILRNALGSDAEVAQFFNTLGLTYLPKPKEDHFERIHNKVEEHYARKWEIKMARIYIDYLKNPWPTLAFFLAPAALLLTIVQTWYAIHPRR